MELRQRRRLIVGVLCSTAVGVLLMNVPGRVTIGAEHVADDEAPRTGTALTGVVSSAKEPVMEGVVVTARRHRANFDVSVVSNAEGRYSFPRSHVEAGTYFVKIRAVGYDLIDPGPVDVTAAATATLDLELEETKDITHQLSSAEWLMNLPGTEAQKAMVQRQMASCTYCHNLEVIVKSTYTAEQFVPVITSMQQYYPDGSSYGIYERRGRAKRAPREEQAAAAESDSWGFWPGVKKADLADYLATINQSGGRRLPIATSAYQTLPRPTGKASRVIVTQYDMPRGDTHPHDSDVDSQGRVWYTDQSAAFLGMLDPKTGTFTEYPMPIATEKFLTGGSDVQVDQDDNVWFPMMHNEVNNHFGLLHKFDTKTKEFIPSTIPFDAFYQFLAMGPDGKIWAGFGEFYRIDPATLEMDSRFNWNESPNKPPQAFAAGYGIAVDADSNPYCICYGANGLVKVDKDTQEISYYPTPTPNSSPRRGMGDDEGRIWFGEYTGDQLGMFDTKTETFREYHPGIKYFSPYTASNPDRDGYVYAPSNTSDRIMRVDSSTGEVVVYLMPTQDFDAKTMRIDPVDGKALLFTNVRNARIMRVEPLD